MPLQIIRQDITKMKVDAIVNTTNEEMVGYSGVDFAVHQGAGVELDKACAKLAPLGLGQVKITKGYKLPSKYIIHTSGPVWRGGLEGESIILKSCYMEALKLAEEKNCRSVAFPLISAGMYGYPKDQALRVAIDAITSFLSRNDMLVYIVIFDKDSFRISEKLVADMLSRMDTISELAGKITVRAPLVTEEYKQKLKARIEEFLKEVKYDESRLLSEVAFYTDRVNIDEELTRLKSHVAQFKKIVSDDESGKKLDFLMQEFNRETNTNCSKSNDIEVTKYALELKNEIEKVREQVQNLE